MSDADHRTTDPSVDHRRITELASPDHGGDPELLVELIGIFLEDSTSRLAELSAAAAMNDRLTITNLAHRLRASAASLGLPRLATLCRELEADIEVERSVIERLLRLVEVEHELVSQQLRGLLARHDPSSRPNSG